MDLVEAKVGELSAITHKVLVPIGDRYPKVKVIAFFGSYRDGSGGANDAKYIRASAAAAQVAWFTPSTIVDLSELSYQWGDEMEWILGIGQDMPVPSPLAIIVGPLCRSALKSLLDEQYADYCVETLEDALAMINVKSPQHEAEMRIWRDRPQSN